MSQELDQMKRQLRELERKVAQLSKDIAILKDRRREDEYVPPVSSPRPRQKADPVLRGMLKAQKKSYVSLD